VGASQQPNGRVSVGNLDGNFNSQLGLYNDAGGYAAWSVPGVDAGNESRAVRHATDQRNAIDAVRTVEANVGVATPTSDVTQTLQYDLAGNLLYDGIYIYQYDGWNRLVQINRALANTTLPITASTPIGVMIKHFTYDGVGRLIRTQSPYPSPDYTANTGDIRSERFYYDGSRRIQEVVLDPTESLAMALMSGDPQLAGDAMQSIAEQEEALTAGELDISAGSISFEAGQMEAGAFTAQGGIGNLPQQPRPEAHRLEREYIWGPGDSFAGVDELFVLFDREREPWLVLQDASGDVAALCGRTSISQPAYVAAQWTWDAYGNVFSADHLFDHPFLSVGHKGLFVERLDVGVADASVPGAQYADTPRLTPFAHHIYHNRNRSHHPTLGRFLQADPNASGVVAVTKIATQGETIKPEVTKFNMEERYGDGANIYQYLRSASWMAIDPTGLVLENITRGMLVGMVTQYASNQEYDVDWALDWALPDDWHSRGDASWIPLSQMVGMVNEFVEQDDGGSPITAVATRGGGNRRSFGAAAVGMTAARLRQVRFEALQVGNTPQKGMQGLTPLGRSLTDHPSFVGVPGLGKGSGVQKHFGNNISAINARANQVAQRYLAQGVPIRAGPRDIKFVMKQGATRGKGASGIRVDIDASGKVQNVTFWD
jgi:hypothetical protein